MWSRMFHWNQFQARDFLDVKGSLVTSCLDRPLHEDNSTQRWHSQWHSTVTLNGDNLRKHSISDLYHCLTQAVWKVYRASSARCPTQSVQWKSKSSKWWLMAFKICIPCMTYRTTGCCHPKIYCEDSTMKTTQYCGAISYLGDFMFPVLTPR